jgi:L-asparaginase II
VLVEVFRGNWVENIHRGSFVVSDAHGGVLSAAGDPSHPVLPRSAIKSMQALALFRSGAVDKFGLDDEAIAMASASHYGEARHIAIVTSTLEKLGLSVTDLECGAHPPTAKAARDALAAVGQVPSALYNNCSGKHTGMLADALALGVPTREYVTREHPVQRLVRACVEEVIGAPLTTHACGTDGCSIPTWAAPLTAFAAGFARMATCEGLPEDLAGAARRIFAAATSHPFLIRGSGSLDTEVMEAFAGRLMLKIGAEGVFCGALIDKGLGFALKIDDGNGNAGECAIANLLLAIAEPNEIERAALTKWAATRNSNWRGIDVGGMRGAAGAFS